MANELPKPPIILNKTNKETDSEKIDGKPEPYAEAENNMVENINEYFLPYFILNDPAIIAPTKQPNSTLPTTQPFIAASKLKCLLK